MRDLPLVILTATIWAYWIGVGAMIVRIRRKTRKFAGLVPEQRLERWMWVIWLPLIAAWIALPYLALSRTAPPLAVADFAREQPLYVALRWIAAVAAVLCLVLTAKCWRRMGKNWRMAVSLESKTELITDGLFARIRHPIYALSILLITCTAVIVATGPMLAVAIVHIALMNLKARNEERHLLRAHGETYERYVQRTGRFFPQSKPPGSGTRSQ